eukprot:gnl/TRDRNA2_/TRDRNA2_182916_c0_seq1.p1 gnl/TRDRNA2_/TRDRNA2_182916_c0~~gnl/TRDRNA2_/TRDRNA2_182916_c0_seq1.p1  ORF type:complete len:293 (-),score=57.81 gnl/TRDRNA2_/TRDRNA2_182916_c0_seq1:140-1018(-)
MGVVLSRAEVVRGLEPLMTFEVDEVRAIFNMFEELCPSPALWERAFSELLRCFDSPEACSKAFQVMDTDGNGLIDAREMLGALAVLSKGHLTKRMELLFDIFDLNKEKEMAFDEVFLMLRRTMGGLRKMVGILMPPEKVIYTMTKQIYKQAKKHRDQRILLDDWYAWWSSDMSCRNGLKIFTWKPEDQRGLPTPEQWLSIDYTKSDRSGDAIDTTESVRAARSLLPPRGPGSRKASLVKSNTMAVPAGSRSATNDDQTSMPIPMSFTGLGGSETPGSPMKSPGGGKLLVPGL